MLDKLERLNGVKAWSESLAEWMRRHNNESFLAFFSSHGILGIDFQSKNQI